MGIGHSAAALDALRPLREQYIEAAPRGLQRRAAVDEVVEVVRDEDAQGPHHIDLERAGDMVQSLVAAVEAALPDPEPKPLAQLVAQLDADALPLAPQFEAFTIPADDPRVPLRWVGGRGRRRCRQGSIVLQARWRSCAWGRLTGPHVLLPSACSGMQGLRAKATLSRRLPPGTFLGYYQ